MREGFVHGVLGDFKPEHPLFEVLVPCPLLEYLKPFAESSQFAPERLALESWFSCPPVVGTFLTSTT
jgi:hypothetical protein